MRKGLEPLVLFGHRKQKLVLPPELTEPYINEEKGVKTAKDASRCYGYYRKKSPMTELTEMYEA